MSASAVAATAIRQRGSGHLCNRRLRLRFHLDAAWLCSSATIMSVPGWAAWGQTVRPSRGVAQHLLSALVGLARRLGVGALRLLRFGSSFSVSSAVRLSNRMSTQRSADQQHLLHHRSDRRSYHITTLLSPPAAQQPVQARTIIASSSHVPISLRGTTVLLSSHVIPLVAVPLAVPPSRLVMASSDTDAGELELSSEDDQPHAATSRAVDSRSQQAADYGEDEQVEQQAEDLRRVKPRKARATRDSRRRQRRGRVQLMNQPSETTDEEDSTEIDQTQAPIAYSLDEGGLSYASQLISQHQSPSSSRRRSRVMQ